jgi:hypothetical protein
LRKNIPQKDTPMQHEIFEKMIREYIIKGENISNIPPTPQNTPNLGRNTPGSGT